MTRTRSRPRRVTGSDIPNGTKGTLTVPLSQFLGPSACTLMDANGWLVAWAAAPRTDRGDTALHTWLAASYNGDGDECPWWDAWTQLATWRASTSRTEVPFSIPVPVPMSPPPSLDVLRPVPSVPVVPAPKGKPPTVFQLTGKKRTRVVSTQEQTQRTAQRKERDRVRSQLRRDRLKRERKQNAKH